MNEEYEKKEMLTWYGDKTTYAHTVINPLTPELNPPRGHFSGRSAI